MKTEKLIEKLEKLTGKKVKLLEGFEEAGLSVYRVWGERSGYKSGISILCKKEDIEKLTPLVQQRFEKSMAGAGTRFHVPVKVTFEWLTNPMIFKKDKSMGESTFKETYVDSPKQVWKVIGTDGRGTKQSFDILTYKDSLTKMLPELQKEFPTGWKIEFEWVTTPRIYKDSNLFKKESVLKEDAKDDQRISDIQSKSNGSGWKAAELAQQMADKITTPEKAYNRYQAAINVFGKDSRVANIFLDRAKVLKHATGTTVANDRDEAQRQIWKQQREEALARAKVKADKFIKIFSKRYPDYKLSLTTSSPVQYQSGDGKTLYVTIGGDLSRLTKGLAGLGDQRVVSRMHGAIRRMADLTGGHYDFNYSKPFVAFSGSKPRNESTLVEAPGEQRGEGKIEVNYKDEAGYGKLYCKAIEVYGDTLAFSDIYGDLIRNDNNKIIQIPLKGILSIKTK